MEVIKNFWLEALCTFMLSGLTIFFRFIYKKYKCDEDERNAIKDEMKSIKGVLGTILHDRFYQQCNYILKKKYITISELENLDLMYEDYHNKLNFNGTGTLLYEKCKSLEIREDDEDEE